MADDQVQNAGIATETATPQVTPDQTVAPHTGDDAPSPAQSQQGDTREELLSAVQQAVPELRTSSTDKDGAGGASPAPSSTSDPSKLQPISPDQLPDDPSPEELAHYSDKAKARIERFLNERRELKGEINRLQANEPAAAQAASVQQYLRDNDIGRDDFLLTLELAAAMRRGDFQAFYEGVKPYVQLAEEYLGHRLPPDLQQAVQQGQMTTQAAVAYSRERMDRGLAQSRFVRTQQLSQEQQQTVAVQQLQQAVVAHVNAWEAAVMRTDPDYGRKKPLLNDVMWSVVRERGTPQSPEQAVEIAKEAYRRAGQHVSVYAPERRPTSRVPSSTGRSNGAAPDPKNLTDVVRQTLERARV